MATDSENRVQALELISKRLDDAEKAKARLERDESMFSSLVGFVWSEYDRYAGHLSEEELTLVQSRMKRLGESPHG